MPGGGREVLLVRTKKGERRGTYQLRSVIRHLVARSVYEKVGQVPLLMYDSSKVARVVRPGRRWWLTETL